MTKLEALKLTGILHDPRFWWMARTPEGRETNLRLARMELDAAARIQSAMCAGEFINAAGQLCQVTDAEREKAPEVIFRLARLADARLTLAGK